MRASLAVTVPGMSERRPRPLYPACTHTHTQLPPRPRTAPRTEGPGTPKGDAPRSMPAMARAHRGEVLFLPRQASRSEERRFTCFAVARDAPCAARWREREPRKGAARVHLTGGAAFSSAIMPRVYPVTPVISLGKNGPRSFGQAQRNAAEVQSWLETAARRRRARHLAVKQKEEPEL